MFSDTQEGPSGPLSTAVLVVGCHADAPQMPYLLLTA